MRKCLSKMARQKPLVQCMTPAGLGTETDQEERPTGLYNQRTVRCVSPGVHVFAACCKATATLNCRVEASAETGLTAGKAKWVECPDGYAMTGCSAFAESGKSGGAKVFSEFSFYP